MQAGYEDLSELGRTRQPISMQTFCERLIASASIRPDKVAITLLNGPEPRTITFNSMLAQIRSIAYRLQLERIAFGDRVAIIGENHPNWEIAYLGILYRGAVVTPLDPAATTTALAAFLRDSDAKLAFISPTSLPKFRAACEQLGQHIPAVSLLPLTERDGLSDFDDWANTPVSEDFMRAVPPARAEDLALLMYTSGTTGTPKAVPLTHGNIYAESTKIQEVMHVSDQEVLLSLLPLFHAYSQIVNLWLATTIGAEVVYLSDLTTTQVERGLKQSHATALVGVPRLWYLFHKKIFDRLKERSAPQRILFRALLAVNGWLRDFFLINAGRLFFRVIHQSFGGRLRLAVSAGASFDSGVALDFHRLGFTILQGYGLTETSGAATVTRFEDNKIGSVGTPLNGVDVRIDEPNEQGIGEVLIRGPVVMSGYYNNPDANRDAFTDGWFRSGDLGRFDQDGHLFIVGRKKDIIKLPNGKNVFPEDVEAHYERSPFVSEVCVVGVRDEAIEFKGAEKLCAVVVPNFDYLRERQIANARDWVVWELENLGRELPEYQRVHDFVMRAEPLPRTSTRKVRRFEVRDQLDKESLKRPAAEEERMFTSAEREVMDSPAGRAVVVAIRNHNPQATVIHPTMNLEIDLALDSLARAECVASIEQALNIELKAELPSVLTVDELVKLVNARLGTSQAQPANRLLTVEVQWHDLLTRNTGGGEFEQLFKEKKLIGFIAFLVLRIVYVGARLLFRMEVKGIENLANLNSPYIICPNHQSYLDPFLVCSTYPFKVLTRIFHVGASMYFTNPIMARLARLINVVPIDPDAQLVRAMQAGAAGLRAGKILNIYPEGQRSFDGQLLEFKKGAAILASELSLPIVPVAIDGTYQIWPRKSWRFRLAKVRLTFGRLVEPAEICAAEKDDEEVVYEKLTMLVKARIQEMLNKMRCPK
jgi:long-chain acyl-CoA synthetase